MAIGYQAGHGAQGQHAQGEGAQNRPDLQIGVVQTGQIERQGGHQQGFGEEEEKCIDNIWSNNPQTIYQCNVEQICYVSEHIISKKVLKLISHKSEIINYIRDNKFDGIKLKETHRKDFMYQIDHF